MIVVIKGDTGTLDYSSYNPFQDTKILRRLGLHHGRMPRGIQVPPGSRICKVEVTDFFPVPQP